eukprot:9385749-Karenia_brevis.AAC.1
MAEALKQATDIIATFQKGGKGGGRQGSYWLKGASRGMRGGDEKGEGKGGAAVKFEGECWYCGKPGHRLNECRQKDADVKKGKGGGKGGVWKRRINALGEEEMVWTSEDESAEGGKGGAWGQLIGCMTPGPHICAANEAQ